MSKNRYALGMVDWRGDWWDFTEAWAAGVKSGGVEGFVGSVMDSTSQPLGEAGHLVTAQHVQPLQGRLVFHCREHDGRSAEEVQARLRAAFSPLQSRRCSVVVTSPGGPVTAQMRLSGPISDPVEDPSWSDMVLNVEVPLITDGGLWFHQTQHGTGMVTVTNYGDATVWVRIRWSGAGGPVLVPSGATFTLPATSSERVLWLSRKASMVVRDSDGMRDDVLWEQLRGAYPEGVPAGESRVFRVPDGATVEWEVGVLNPWM